MAAYYRGKLLSLRAEYRGIKTMEDFVDHELSITPEATPLFTHDVKYVGWQYNANASEQFSKVYGEDFKKL